MLTRRSKPPRSRDMTLLVVTSAGAAILAGLLIFPILMSGPVAATEASSPEPTRLPTPPEAEPDEYMGPDAVCTCEMALTIID